MPLRPLHHNYLVVVKESVVWEIVSNSYAKKSTHLIPMKRPLSLGEKLYFFYTNCFMGDKCKISNITIASSYPHGKQGQFSFSRWLKDVKNPTAQKAILTRKKS